MRLAGEPMRSFATNEIASEFGISRNHLAKVVRDLADGGFITTQRGAGGGFTLARPPQSITLGEVVRALEERHALVECFRGDGGTCVLTAALPFEGAACRRARSLHAGTRRHDAGGMRLSRAAASRRARHEVCRMKPVEFENGAVAVEASVIAEGLGIALPLLQQQMQAGRSPAGPSAASTRTAAAIA